MLAAVHEYEEELVAALSGCAQSLVACPHIALVESRRAAEAVSGILRCAGSGQRHELPTGDNNDGLQGFVAKLRKDKLITEVIQQHLETIRTTANKGAHVGLSRRAGHADWAATVKVPLSATVRWLYDRSVARQLLRHRAQAVTHADTLDGELARQVLVQTELQALREDHLSTLAAKDAAHANKVRELEVELQALIHRERTLHDAIQQAEARALAADKERKAAEALAKQRAIEVEAAKKKLAEALQRVENPGFFATLSRTVRFLAVAGFGATALTALGATGLFLFKDELKQALDRSDDAEIATPVAASAALSAPSPAPTPPALARCPAGTIQVAAAALRLEQPEGRKTWPPAPAGADKVSVSVPTFCVETDRVERAELPADLRLSDQSQDCLDAHGGNWLRCLSGEEAAAVCAQRLPNGRLPQIAELEALARDPAAMDRVRFSRSKLELEWLEDSFPPAVFKRPAEAGRSGHMTRKRFDGEPHDRPTALHWAYNQPPDRSKQAELVGFRCAAPLSPPL
ncbi:MAG: hypothetical protein JNM72_17655 [Deltaproteobacteria bacterium]|nr:hypothetical protein [Deltaproteobacteria bacterium]